MLQNTIEIRRNKKIALVAHDNKKEELFEWARCNCELLAEHSLYATGTTGLLLKSRLGLNVTHLESGPLGGDQQIGSRIAEGNIDFVIFFLDPLEPQPHDADVKALLRIAMVWNVPFACNRASADFIISSPLMSTVYQRLVPDYSKYRSRLAVSGTDGDESASLNQGNGRLCDEDVDSRPLITLSTAPPLARECAEVETIKQAALELKAKAEADAAAARWIKDDLMRRYKPVTVIRESAGG